MGDPGPWFVTNRGWRRLSDWGDPGEPGLLSPKPAKSAVCDVARECAAGKSEYSELKLVSRTAAPGWGVDDLR